MAVFSQKERKIYQNLCHAKEKGVLSLMRDVLVSKYTAENVVATPSYVYALGEIPVAVVAHADTVFKAPPDIDNFFYDQEKEVIWNPDGAGADDRAGVFAILMLIRKYKLRPHVIITTGEESGCIGAGKLIVALPQFPKDLRFMIQLDRRGHTDSVYYDCDNKEFEEFINKFGFKTEWGTFTDISLLAPAWKVAAVNLSIGYEDEHHPVERLHVDWMYETIEKTANILHYVDKNRKTVPTYPYIPAADSWHYRPYGYGWYDDDDDDLYDPWDAKDRCLMCQKKEKPEDMLQIWYPHGMHPYSLCLNCYSKVCDQIVWCKNCNKGYFLAKDAAKKIPDVNNWVCEVCNDRKLSANSETVQQGTGVQSGLPVQSTAQDGSYLF